VFLGHFFLIEVGKKKAGLKMFGLTRIPSTKKKAELSFTSSNILLLIGSRAVNPKKCKERKDVKFVKTIHVLIR
jgi:hypothetical protein